ncbi:MAG: hypothetical protein JXA54_09270 [Candidatus Heimdallarchaeota archaeon]|nr:hypothetical protein [Candidatus Heimdallarchaeota archaeon]
MDIEVLRVELKKSEIVLGMLKIFGITFGLTAIIPILLAISFLINYWSQIEAWTFTYNYYGDLPIALDLGALICQSLMITFPISIACAIGKGCMFSKYKYLIFIIVPIVTLVLMIAFFYLGDWILLGVGYRWL